MVSDTEMLANIEGHIEEQRLEIMAEYDKDWDQEWLSHAFPFLELQLKIKEWRENKKQGPPKEGNGD